MRTIQYKRSSLFHNAGGCLVLSAVGAWAAFSFEGTWMILGGCLAVTLPFVAIAMLLKAMGDCTAIQFDDRGVRVSTLYSNKTMSWAEVVNVHRELLQQSHFLGLYKKDIATYVVFTPLDGAMFGKLKINAALLDMPQASVDALIEEMGRTAAHAKLGRAEPRPAAEPAFAAGAPAGRISRPTAERGGVASGPKAFGRRSSR